MFCTSTRPTHGVMPLEGARWWSPTLIPCYSFVPEKCQGHFVSVPKKEQTSKPWRLLWNRAVLPLALLIKLLNVLIAQFLCYCWWDMVFCMSSRHVSSLVTKRFLGYGFIELFQAELGCCVLPVLWCWYRAGLSCFVQVKGKNFNFLSFRIFEKYTYFRKQNTYNCSLPPSPHPGCQSFLKRVCDFLITFLQKACCCLQKTMCQTLPCPFPARPEVTRHCFCMCRICYVQTFCECRSGFVQAELSCRVWSQCRGLQHLFPSAALSSSPVHFG